MLRSIHFSMVPIRTSGTMKNLDPSVWIGTWMVNKKLIKLSSCFEED